MVLFTSPAFPPSAFGKVSRHETQGRLSRVALTTNRSLGMATADPILHPTHDQPARGTGCDEVHDGTHPCG